MAKSGSTYRILYRDVDQMGFLYYGRYLALAELGRVDWMRDGGLSYRDLEDEYRCGLPVTRADVRYYRPLRYDDLACIETDIAAWSPTTVRFVSAIQAEDGVLRATAEVELGCISLETQRPARMPQDFLAILERLAPDRRGRRR